MDSTSVDCFVFHSDFLFNMAYIPSSSLECSSFLSYVSYRIRSFSEKGPFDGSTFTFLSAFLDCVVREHALIGHGEDEDEPVERMMLVIEVVNLHASECKN